MGATQSKTTQPVIFYNQSSPLQFGQQPEEPIKSEKKPIVASTPESNEKIEQLVRERVAEELKRAQEHQEQANKRAYGDLAKKNIQNDHNSVALGEDIGSMIQKLQRSTPADIPAEIAARQEELIVCYKNNQSRPLDCWEEVEKFKDAVASEQRKFVASHQR